MWQTTARSRPRSLQFIIVIPSSRLAESLFSRARIHVRTQLLAAESVLFQNSSQPAVAACRRVRSLTPLAIVVVNILWWSLSSPNAGRDRKRQPGRESVLC